MTLGVVEGIIRAIPRRAKAPAWLLLVVLFGVLLAAPNIDRMVGRSGLIDPALSIAQILMVLATFVFAVPLVAGLAYLGLAQTDDRPYTPGQLAGRLGSVLPSTLLVSFIGMIAAVLGAFAALFPALVVLVLTTATVAGVIDERIDRPTPWATLRDLALKHIGSVLAHALALLVVGLVAVLLGAVLTVILALVISAQPAFRPLSHAPGAFAGAVVLAAAAIVGVALYGRVRTDDLSEKFD